MAQMLKNNFVKPSNGLDFSRSLFPREVRHSTNMLSGAIVPVYQEFLYPGSSPSYNFGCVIESAPLISTNLDNMYVDIVLIWCPVRLVMTDYEEWLGASHTQAFTINRNIKFPKINTVYTHVYDLSSPTVYMTRAYYAEHYLAPHIGFRYRVDAFNAHSGLNLLGWVTSSTSVVSTDSIFHDGVQVLPSRIYELNWNTFFRNENIQNPILIDKTSVVGSHDATYQFGLGKIQFANKLKDYFTTATPAPSLLDVSIAMDEYLAPVSTTNLGVDPLHFYNTDLSTFVTGTLTAGSSGNAFVGSKTVAPDNLVADLSRLTVNRMYYALMLQKFAYKMEKGRRAPEFIETFFGVKNSEAGHDLPLLITQKRYPLNMSQVITTANSDNVDNLKQPVGSIGAYSVTGFGGSLVKNFIATEHGYLQAYAIIRGQPSIASGIDRHLAIGGLLENTYITQFDHVGPVAIEVLELAENYFLPNVTSTSFGFTNYGNDIRKPISTVVGIMEPGQPLAYKSLAVDYTVTGLVINDAWLRFNPTIIDRIFLYKVCGLGTPNTKFQDSDGNQWAYDAYGEPTSSNRYQFLIQFVVKGNLAAVMSPDGDPLQMRL